MFETSGSTEKLDAALAKAQGEIKSAGKSAVNPHFRKNYADLSDIWEACHEALSKNGVSVTQWLMSSDDGKAHLLTRIACAGEWMRSTFSLPVMKNDAQAYGAAITYLRRFSLAAAVGVVSGDDDDAANSESILKDKTDIQKDNVAKIKAAAASPAHPKPKAPPKNFAPGAINHSFPADDFYPAPEGGDSPPWPPHEHSQEIDQDLERYTIPFGKHTGKTFSELGPLEARKYLEWLEGSAKKENKPMTENALRYKNMYERFCKQQGHQL